MKLEDLMSKKTSRQEPSADRSNQTGGAGRPKMDRPNQASPSAPSEIFAINFLERQHAELRNLFSQMNQETSEIRRSDLLERVATFLRNHSALEQRYFYPGVLTKETEKLVNEGRKDHKEAEEMLEDLLQSESFEDDFIKDFQKLVDAVQNHLQEEESSLFPKVVKEIPIATLVRIGEEMEEAYQLMDQAGPSVADETYN
jgi:hemerythrin-like domain-containing protein